MIVAKLNDDVHELYSRSPDALTAVTEQYKITWFYSTSQGLYLRGPAADLRPAYDYLTNNVLNMLDALENSADQRQNGHGERSDHRQRNGDDNHRREERPDTPEVQYAVVNKKKDRDRTSPEDRPERGRHRRDGGREEHTRRRRESRSPAGEPRERKPEVSLVNTPGYVKAYIRGVYHEDLNRMKGKYGVLFRDHPDGTIVEATDQCKSGWLRDACEKLKEMNREVEGFVKETTIPLDKYGLSADDVEAKVEDVRQTYREVLISRSHDNAALYMIGDENDMYKAKTALMEAIQPSDTEKGERGRGHRRKTGGRGGDHGRKRKGDRGRSVDMDGSDGSPGRGGDDRDRRGSGDRSRDVHLEDFEKPQPKGRDASRDRHVDDDHDRPRKGDRSRNNHVDDDHDRPMKGDRSRDRHVDDDHDRPRKGDWSRDRHLDRNDDTLARRDDDRRRRKHRDKHLDGDYDRPRGGDKYGSRNGHLDEDEDRPRRKHRDPHTNGDYDRPGKAHGDMDRERDRDREHRKKDTDRPRGNKNVAFEHVFRKAGLTVTVQKSHVLDQDVDSIVNPTDKRLENARGLSAEIAKEAGSKFRHECSDIVRKHGPLETGDVTTTGGGHLTCRYVLSVCEPRSSKHGSRLRDACRNVMKKCAKKSIASVAIPPIGSGTCVR